MVKYHCDRCGEQISVELNREISISLNGVIPAPNGAPPGVWRRSAVLCDPCRLSLFVDLKHFLRDETV